MSCFLSDFGYIQGGKKDVSETEIRSQVAQYDHYAQCEGSKKFRGKKEK